MESVGWGQPVGTTNGWRFRDGSKGLNLKERASTTSRYTLEAIMKLFYRGLAYDYNLPAATVVKSNVGYKARGLDYQFRSARQLPVQLPNLNLVYRGVAYQTGDGAVQSDVSVPTVAQPTAVQPTVAVAATQESAETMARSLMMSHHRSVKIRQQALLSRSAAEIGIQAGNDMRWDRIQGKIHPTFWADYDHSHAALS